MASIEGLKAVNALAAQIITVSSGLLAFTVTFAEKFAPKDGPILAPGKIRISWVLFAVTILLGFWTLMAAAGTLDEIDRGGPESNPRRWNIRIPAVLMLGAFLLAVVFLIMAGWSLASR